MLRLFGFALPMSIIAITAVSHSASAETNFPQLITGSGTKELCQLKAAEDCIGHVWSRVDSDGDELLSVVEIDNFIAHVRRWNAFTDRSLTDRAVVKLALAAYALAGTERLVAAYDNDADGMLSKDEGLADLYLDERPIAELLLDGNAFDAEALAARFGVLAPQFVRAAQTAGSSFGGVAPDAAIAATRVEEQEQIGAAQ